MLRTYDLGAISEHLSRFVAAVKGAALASGVKTITYMDKTVDVASYVINEEVGVDVPLAKIAIMTAKRLGGSDFDGRIGFLAAVDTSDDNALYAAKAQIAEKLEDLSPAFERAMTKTLTSPKWSKRIALAAIVGVVVGTGAYIGAKVWKRRSHY